MLAAGRRPPGAAAGRRHAAPAFSVWSSQIFTTADQPSFSLTYRGPGSPRLPRLPRRRSARVLRRSARPARSSAARSPSCPQERTLDRAHRRLEGGRRGARSGRSSGGRSAADYRAQRRGPRGPARRSRRRQTLQYNSFAQVPLLNPERLVASWREILPRVRDAETRRIPLDAPGAGRLRRRGRQRAAQGLHHRRSSSDVGLVTKTAPGQMLVFAADRLTGAPQQDCAMQVARRPAAARDRHAPARTARRCSRSTRQKPDVVVTVARCGDAGHRDRSRAGWALQRAGARTGRLRLHRQADLPARPHGAHQGRAAVADPRARSRRSTASRSRSRSPTRTTRCWSAQTRPVDAFGAVSTSFAVPAARRSATTSSPSRQRRRPGERQLRSPGVPQAGVRGHRDAAGALRRPGRAHARPR